LAFEPSRIKSILAGILGKIMPGLVQPSGLNAIYLSHNQSVIDLYKTDPLVHDKISTGLFVSAMNAANHSLINASQLKVPTLILHGSDDKICSPEGSREFAGKASSAKLKIWDGGYHELHNEPFNDEVFSYIINWIKTAKN
jgi:alpha-beta hydrolase superfamily lysophospholipase